jgi:hypothetical protein
MAARGVCCALIALALAAAVPECRSVSAAEPADAAVWRAAPMEGPKGQYEPATQEISPPTSSPDDSAFNVTVRMWYTAVSKTEATNRSISTTQMPLYGGSMTFVPGSLGGTAFYLSAYYGVSVGVNDFQDIKSEGQSNLSRLDIEALVQIPFGATGGAYASLGFRYIDFVRKDTGIARDVFIIGDSFSYTRQSDYKYFLGELGVGTVTQVDSEGSHRLFGGGMIIGGAANTARDLSTLGNVAIPAFVFDAATGSSSSGLSWVVGVDTHFGYAYSPSKSTAFSMRYRAFVLTETFLNLHVRFIDYSHYSLVHGPEINFTYKFN